MTDFRTIRERYDWVGLAKAMACASFLCRRVAADSAEIISPHPP